MAAEMTEITALGTRIGVAANVLEAIGRTGLVSMYQIRSYKGGELNGILSDTVVGAFMAVLATDSTVDANDETTVAKVRELLVLIANGADDSAQLARGVKVTTPGTGNLDGDDRRGERSARDEQETAAAYAAVQSSYGLTIPPQHRATSQFYRKVHDGLMLRGQLHPSVALATATTGTELGAERRYQITGGMSVVTEQAEVQETTKTGAALTAISRNMYAVLAVGCREVPVIPDNPVAYTNCERGVVTMNGARISWIATMNEIFAYLFMLLVASATLSCAQIKYVHAHYVSMWNDSMVVSGDNVSTAISRSMSTTTPVAIAGVGSSGATESRQRPGRRGGVGGGGGGGGFYRAPRQLERRAPGPRVGQPRQREKIADHGHERRGNDRPAEERPDRRQRGADRDGTCDNFNRQAGCTRRSDDCKYRHQCHRCGSRDHGASACDDTGK